MLTNRLNPLAPEYNPISSGIIAVVHHHPPPPPPVYLLYSSSSIFTTYTIHQYPFYQTSTSCYLPQPKYHQSLYSGSGPLITPTCNDKKQEDKNMQEGEGEGEEEEDKNRHQIIPLKWDLDNTTVMIKNIPYDCSRKEMIEILDAFCKMENWKQRENLEGSRRTKHKLPISSSVAYDFLYLPVDFRTRKSRGFAFVNFTGASAVKKFYNAFHLSKWDFISWSKWPKIIQIVAAKIQGKEDLMNHFSGSVFDCESEEYLPVSFSPARDGSGRRVNMEIVGSRGALARSHREMKRFSSFAARHFK